MKCLMSREDGMNWIRPLLLPQKWTSLLLKQISLLLKRISFLLRGICLLLKGIYSLRETRLRFLYKFYILMRCGCLSRLRHEIYATLLCNIAVLAARWTNTVQKPAPNSSSALKVNQSLHLQRLCQIAEFTMHMPFVFALSETFFCSGKEQSESKLLFSSAVRGLVN